MFYYQIGHYIHVFKRWGRNLYLLFFFVRRTNYNLKEHWREEVEELKVWYRGLKWRGWVGLEDGEQEKEVSGMETAPFL